jgi:UDP-N-acetylmuramoyl-tripeptide--D-alanyl-D-alanine ligase
MRFSAAEVLREVAGGADGPLPEVFPAVVTDSRSLPPGALFVALRGERHDGHDFVPQALAAGAGAVVVRSSFTTRPGAPVIRVEDPGRALLQLGLHARRRWGGPLVAITGSVGKTTTKELLAHLLGGPPEVLAAEKSFNNAVGVPLTLLRLEPAHRVAVLELGTNAPGEIRALAEACEPDVGVITGIAEAHLEGLGDLDGVLNEKADLVRRLRPAGTAVLNADDARLRGLAPGLGCRVLWFGSRAGAAVRGTNARRVRGGISFQLEAGPRVRLPMAGLHNRTNALAALAAGQAVGRAPGSLAGRCADFAPPPLRMEERSVRGVHLIADLYNANPCSMQAALEELRTRRNGRRVLVAGDMKELGRGAPSYHREVGAAAATSGIDLICAVGPLARYTAEGARASGAPAERVLHFETVEEAARELPARVAPGDTVMIKGSRVLRLERLAAAFEAPHPGSPELSEVTASVRPARSRGTTRD